MLYVDTASCFVASFSLPRSLLSYPIVPTTSSGRPLFSSTDISKTDVGSRKGFVVQSSTHDSGNSNGSVAIVAGVEAHIQFSLPRKIFCECSSTASGLALPNYGSCTSNDNDKVESPDVGRTSRCQELYHRLSSVLNTLSSENMKRATHKVTKRIKEEAPLSFDEYISLYNMLHPNTTNSGAYNEAIDLSSADIHRLNEFTCPICKGEVGSVPSLSPLAILYGLYASHVYSCHPSSSLSFDRKVYSYPDLPKRYQLTQVHNPIGTDGRLILENGREISIQRVNLEEDTARTLSDSGATISLDYNRSGIGLIEVVTAPSELTVDELVECCTKIYQMAVSSGLSKGHMHEGNVRFDINVSIPSKGNKRIELKNLSSFRRIRRAVLVCTSSDNWDGNTTPSTDEAQDNPRQEAETCDTNVVQDHISHTDDTNDNSKAWTEFMQRISGESNVPVASAPVGSTLKWRSDSNDVGYQRVKSHQASYLNVADGNIPTIMITGDLFDRIAATAPPDDRPTLDSLRASYPTAPLDLLAVIQKNVDNIDLFKRLCSLVGDERLVAKWIVNYVIPSKLTFIDARRLSELINAVSLKKLNLDTAREILVDFLSSGMCLADYMRENDLCLLDEEESHRLVDNYLAEYNITSTNFVMTKSSITQLVTAIVASYNYRLNYRTVRDYLIATLGPCKSGY
ncbi:aspartyl glutamyl-tRNA amidotransferase subunit B [Babesia ovis]|uniref:Aspartyl glutamyl-tRNA amidotransferase subunit B n=1 Tax=Babesia ovis TaxID=5869 RepID=A0A9W5T7W4_BABOV|nr:aspartyl glutamyl-tRNA amidotransferase subunit B [Babesia ovis]